MVRGLEVNSIVYIRLYLHSEGRSSVLRGAQGVVLQLRPWLVVDFEQPGRSIHVRCNVEWLELSPGKVSCALSENNASMRMFYTLGMIANLFFEGNAVERFRTICPPKHFIIFIVYFIVKI